MPKATAEATANEAPFLFDGETMEQTKAPKTDRQLEREQKIKAIRYLEIPTVASSNLIGAEFDIIDAVRKNFQDQLNVAFIIRLKTDLSGLDFKKDQILSVSKALNSYSEAYLEYFETFAEGEEIVPFYSYTFVKLTEGGSAGNKPIVLRKL